MKQLQRNDRAKPSGKREHFMDEAANEADQGSAAEQQNDEDIECGHGAALANM